MRTKLSYAAVALLAFMLLRGSTVVPASRQVLLFNILDTVPGGATVWDSMCIPSANSTGFGGGWFPELACLFPAAGTLSNMYLRHDDAQPAGGDMVSEIWVNNAATGITVTVPANQAAGGIVTDNVHTFNVSAGDLMMLKTVNSGGSPDQVTGVGLVFTPR
jgi:hypothetical protein